MYLIQYDGELYKYMSFRGRMILIKDNEKKYDFDWYEYSKLVDEGRVRIVKK